MVFLHLDLEEAKEMIAVPVQVIQRMKARVDLASKVASKVQRSREVLAESWMALTFQETSKVRSLM